MNAGLLSSIVIVVLILTSNVRLTDQLECYVCQNQDDNKGKCAETVKICDLEQEQCLTEVRWGSVPNWVPTGQKQHYISKRCATKQECQLASSDRDHKCDRVGYNDWNCTTCCSGDKCNYYVTLSASSLSNLNPLIILGLCKVASILQYYLSKHTIPIN